MGEQSLPRGLAVIKERSMRLTPTRADITVSIEGDAFFSGNEAFKKAKAVRQLVTDLAGAGIHEEQMSLDDVQLRSKSGLLTRSSEVTYTITILDIPAESVNGVLNVAASQKDLTLKLVLWHYDDLDDCQARLYAELAVACQAQAESTAAAMGVTLGGLETMVPTWQLPDQDPYRAMDDFGDAMFCIMESTRHSAVAALSLTHKSSMKLSLRAVYAIAPSA